MLKRQSKSLEELRELARIFSSSGPIEVGVHSLRLFEKSERTIARLYRLIIANPEDSEITLQKKIEHPTNGLNGNPIRVPSFAKLKSRLKALLLNSLFFLDLDRAGFSSYSQLLYSVNRDAFLSSVLSSLGARTLSASIARHSLGRAISIEEWSIAMRLLIILRSEASQSGESKQHEIYKREYLHCQKLLIVEQEAEVELEKVQIEFAKFGGESPALADLIEQAGNKVNRLASEFPSYKLRSLAIYLHSLAAQIRLDYIATLKYCEEGLQLLETYPLFSNRARKALYSIKKLVASVQLRDGDNVQNALVACSALLNDREDNWFVYKEWEFLYLMHSRKFDDAYRLVGTIFAHSRFPTLTKPAQEKWELFKMFAEFVTGRRVPVTESEDFASLIPILTADKQGFNTSLILLHVLLLAERKQFNLLRERMEFIKGYRKRFLKGPESSHASHLFAMLAAIETCDLNYRKVVSRTAKQLAELQRMETEEPIQGEQILPYTWIWARILEKLGEYHHVAHNS